MNRVEGAESDVGRGSRSPEAGNDDETFRPVNRRGMRTGFTTGACATAAAKAATTALLRQKPVAQVTIHLPAGSDATFAIVSCDLQPGSCRCSIIKDAGDDPDVTHGAEIRATVSWDEHPGVHLKGGQGVGVVTRAGLGLEIGGPAINPVPRHMILEAVQEAAASVLDRHGLLVEVSVPQGEELAKKTLNGRLGIVGGISILGTTGIVRPWSTASWRASVEQAIDVAAANGQRHVVLTTGGRSEKFAMALLSLPELAFVEMGIFTGRALRRCVARGVRRVSLAGMVGKFSKLAQGHFQTHVAGNQVDPGFLADVARRSGATDPLLAEIRAANTARHVQELVEAAGVAAFFHTLAQDVADRSHAYVAGKLQVEAVLFDFDGTILGRADAGG
ncbi:MAG: cobalt-precorrin-5B (C(1))-methyltransferase [Chloroflexi bacterium]|nr:cobalt-precorrin-5B (C(1))-methyltransferase [Chloroflexota bacterium]